MKTQNTNNNEAVYVDTVAQDFKAAVFVVSLFVNLTVFVSWMVLRLS